MRKSIYKYICIHKNNITGYDRSLLYRQSDLFLFYSILYNKLHFTLTILVVDQIAILFP